MSEEEEDTIEVEERGLFPLLLSDKDTETGETKHYYVKIGEYNKNLFNSVDVMDDDGIWNQKGNSVSLFIF
jgi:hypothetical protein